MNIEHEISDINASLAQSKAREESILQALAELIQHINASQGASIASPNEILLRKLGETVLKER